MPLTPPKHLDIHLTAICNTAITALQQKTLAVKPPIALTAITAISPLYKRGGY
jgi:hypothetical protein